MAAPYIKSQLGGIYNQLAQPAPAAPVPSVHFPTQTVPGMGAAMNNQYLIGPAYPPDLQAGDMGGLSPAQYYQYISRQQGQQGAFDLRQQEQDLAKNQAQAQFAQNFVTQGMDPDTAAQLAAAMVNGEDITPHLPALARARLQQMDNERRNQKFLFVHERLKLTPPMVPQFDNKGNPVFEPDPNNPNSQIPRMIPADPTTEKYKQTIAALNAEFDAQNPPIQIPELSKPSAPTQEISPAGKTGKENYYYRMENGKKVYESRPKSAPQEQASASQRLPAFAQASQQAVAPVAPSKNQPDFNRGKFVKGKSMVNLDQDIQNVATQFLVQAGGDPHAALAMAQAAGAQGPKAQQVIAALQQLAAMVPPKPQNIQDFAYNQIGNALGNALPDVNTLANILGVKK